MTVASSEQVMRRRNMAPPSTDPEDPGDVVTLATLGADSPPNNGATTRF
jgi:hypothetical protein